jgi:hypothetical protein
MLAQFVERLCVASVDGAEKLLRLASKLFDVGMDG